MAAVLLAVPATIAVFCLFVAAIKGIIMPRCEPGIYPVESWFYLRKWSVDCLLRMSSGLLYPLYTTIYLPCWLRMLGAKIGARAEISTVTQMSPDLVEIDDESFFADGSIVGGRRFFRGHVQLARNRIGRRTFVGNSALVPVGAELAGDCLVGVLSVSPGGVGGTTPDRTEWLGSPPFRLPFRQKVEGFDASTTYKPTVKLYVLRCIIDALRIVLPYYITALVTCLYPVCVLAAVANLPLWAVFALSPLIATGVVIIAGVYVIAIKQVLMGTFRPVIKPLWSVYVWFNEVVNGVYETIGASILPPIMGTPAMSWFLRRMGCKVGKHSFIETELFSEFDLVDIGDHAALNAGVVIQNHLFEDRIMKSSYLRVGDECSVGNMSVVLYDTEMEAGSSIGPLSLLMKGESLPRNSRWIGIPTSQE
jgi:non-ribosomal peptide synthetase-like protein